MRTKSLLLALAITAVTWTTASLAQASCDYAYSSYGIDYYLDSNTGASCTPCTGAYLCDAGCPPCCTPNGSCSGSCGTSGVDNCGNSCSTSTCDSGCPDASTCGMCGNAACCVPNGSCSGSCGSGGVDNCGNSCSTSTCDSGCSDASACGLCGNAACGAFGEVVVNAPFDGDTTGVVGAYASSAWPATAVFHRPDELVMNNLAKGVIRSPQVSVSAGQVLTASVWVRGEVDTTHSWGGWSYGARFFDASGTELGWLAFHSAASVTPNVWHQQGGSVTAPTGLTTVSIELAADGIAGWLNFDDVSVSGITLQDTGFETGWWINDKDPDYDATSIVRGTWGTYDNHSGSYGIHISNHQYNHTYSPLVPVTPGQSYTGSVWLRGEINTASSYGSWIFRVSWYDASGAYISYNNFAHTGSLNTTSWTQKSGTATAPSNATQARIYLYNYMSDGWVNYDDVSVPGMALQDTSFENGGWWVESKNGNWPASSTYRHTWGVSAPHSGSKGLGLSNSAYGYTYSNLVPVAPGDKLTGRISARGGVQNLASYNGNNYTYRVYWYNAANVNIGSCFFDTATLSAAYTRRVGVCTAPANAANGRVYVHFYLVSGWLAINDMLVERGDTTSSSSSGGSASSDTRLDDAYAGTTTVAHTLWSQNDSDIMTKGGKAMLVQNPLGGDYDKPVVMLTGFDFEGSSAGKDELFIDYTLSSAPGLLELLQGDGFDVWVIRFGDAYDGIHSNGRALAKMLKQISDYGAENGTTPKARYTRLLGMSLGGIIGRYALAWAEDECMDHDGDMQPVFNNFDDPSEGCSGPRDDFDHGVRLFLSLDGAQDGANLSPWLQALTQQAQQSGMVDGVDVELIETLATRQLLTDRTIQYNVCGSDDSGSAGVPASRNGGCDIMGGSGMGDLLNIFSAALIIFFPPLGGFTGIVAGGLSAWGSIIKGLNDECAQLCCDVGDEMTTGGYAHDDFFYMLPPNVGGLWDLNAPHNRTDSYVCSNELGGLPWRSYNVGIGHGTRDTSNGAGMSTMMTVDLDVSSWVTFGSDVGCDQYYAATAADHAPGSVLPVTITDALEGVSVEDSAGGSGPTPQQIVEGARGAALKFMAKGLYTKLATGIVFNGIWGGLNATGLANPGWIGSNMSTSGLTGILILLGASWTAFDTEMSLSFDFYPTFITTRSALMLVEPDNSNYATANHSTTWTRFDRAWHPGASWWHADKGAPSANINMRHTPSQDDPTEKSVFDEWEIPLIMHALNYPNALSLAQLDQGGANGTREDRDFPVTNVGSIVLTSAAGSVTKDFGSFGGIDRDMDGVTREQGDVCDYDATGQSAGQCIENDPPCAVAGPAVNNDVGFLGFAPQGYRASLYSADTLDATASFDPDGDALSYEWTILNNPRFGYCYPYTPGSTTFTSCSEITFRLPEEWAWGPFPIMAEDLDNNRVKPPTIGEQFGAGYGLTTNPSPGATLTGASSTSPTPHIQMKPIWPWHNFFNIINADIAVNNWSPGTITPVNAAAWLNAASWNVSPDEAFNSMWLWDVNMDKIAHFIEVDTRLQVVDEHGLAGVYDFTKVLRTVGACDNSPESIALRTAPGGVVMKCGTSSLEEQAQDYMDYINARLIPATFGQNGIPSGTIHTPLSLCTAETLMPTLMQAGLAFSTREQSQGGSIQDDDVNTLGRPYGVRPATLTVVNCATMSPAIIDYCGASWDPEVPRCGSMSYYDCGEANGTPVLRKFVPVCLNEGAFTNTNSPLTGAFRAQVPHLPAPVWHRQIGEPPMF